jgi:hypothetical protein
MWVNAQQYSQANLTALMTALNSTVRGYVVPHPPVIVCIVHSQCFISSSCWQASRSFVGGIVYGPHERLSMLQYVEAMPSGYPLRQYPDLCHTIFSQFEIFEWDPALAFTHNRQAVFPMPRMVSPPHPCHYCIHLFEVVALGLLWPQSHPNLGRRSSCTVHQHIQRALKRVLPARPGGLWNVL